MCLITYHVTLLHDNNAANEKIPLKTFDITSALHKTRC